MSSELVTIATFMTPEHAEMARGALQAAGVRAFIADGAVVGNNWGLGNAVGGVKLQVGDRDVRTACDLLDEFKRQNEAAGDAIPAWQCSSCHQQVDAGFELCWSCGAARDGSHHSDMSLVDENTAAGDRKKIDDNDELHSEESTSDADFDNSFSEGIDRAQLLRIATLGLLVSGAVGFVAWSIGR